MNSPETPAISSPIMAPKPPKSIHIAGGSRSSQKRRHCNGNGDQPSDDVAAPESRKRSRKRKKKIKKTEFFADLSDENVEQGKKTDGQKVEEVEELVMNQDDGQGTQEEISGAAESAVTIVNAAADNAVLRKLLRGPRYFDPGESTGQACFNCNEEGHIAANCPMERRQKPCFICGLFGHIGKQCKQGQDCFICKKRGHYAKDCPDKQKKVTGEARICLWCGDTGHDMLTCRNDYPSDDMKEVQCYVCKQNGHLCCVDFAEASPEEVSCYKCAGSGHTGLGCAKTSVENNEFEHSPATCYKCGEEGHFARGCKKASKSVRSLGESPYSTPWKLAKGTRYNHGFKSVPNDFGKAKKRKNLAYEDEREMNNVKGKKRGSWISDDPGDVHRDFRGYTDAYPRTPVRKSHRDYSFRHNEDFSNPKSYYKNSPDLGTPNYHSPSNSYQQRWSASRSVNSNRRYW